MKNSETNFLLHSYLNRLSLIIDLNDEDAIFLAREMVRLTADYNAKSLLELRRQISTPFIDPLTMIDAKILDNKLLILDLNEEN